MKTKRYQLAPNNEIRGFVIRLYPDRETEEKLAVLQFDLRKGWNWLVKQTQDVLDARVAYALKHQLVGSRPITPDYNGLTPEEAKTKKQEHIEACQNWYKSIYEATNSIEGCSFRKFKDLLAHFRCEQDYQLLSKVIGWSYEDSEEERLIKPNAHMLQGLVKNYFTKGINQRRKKFRRSNDPMPIQVRSRICFKLGEFGTRGKQNKPFYNCQVSINGLKIKGRLPGKTPMGRVLEGVSLRKEADGWYASIKEEVPIRQLSEAKQGSIIGIDVGLDNIAAMSDGTLIENERGSEFVKTIAKLQEEKKPTGRVHQKYDRYLKHQIYNEIIKPLAQTETIKIEKLSSRIGQMGSSKVSVMRSIRHRLLERYGAKDAKGQPCVGNRVREVECAYTSQDCSQCGKRSKETWSYEHGKVGKCPKCGYEEHRDINAARNIAAKDAIPLDN